MRIVVFGGTGPTGQRVIREALRRGHEVVAYARNPHKIELEHERLSVVSGELSDTDAIRRTLDGADAVISLVGVGVGTKGTAVSDGIIGITDAMKELGVRRLLQISTPTVPDPGDGRDLYLTAMAKLLKLTSKNIYSELIRYSEAVRSSGLDWTLVRIPFLNDDPAKGYRVGLKGDPGMSHKLTRDDLATFLIDAVESGSYVRESPFVSN